MAKSVKIRDLNPFHEYEGDLAFLEFKNLLMNSVRIEGLDFNKERLVKSALIEGGMVGYDKLTDKWAWIYGQGLNEMGDPLTLTFVFRNGRTFTRPASYEPKEDGAYRILALPDTYSLAEVIVYTTNIMKQCDKAIKQNLEACMTPMIISVKDEDTRLSIEHAIEQKKNGVPIVVVGSSISEALSGIELKTPYLVEQFAMYREQERDKLLNKLGIMSANINKKERVQVGEVNATTGQCSDYIYALIDTFNKQMETYNLPFKMVFNGALEELYENNNGEQEENDKLENNNI